MVQTGPKELTEETQGVNYRALNDLFYMSEMRKDTFSYEISVQMMEIYNEQVRDLLPNNGGNNKRYPFPMFVRTFFFSFLSKTYLNVEKFKLNLCRFLLGNWTYNFGHTNFIPFIQLGLLCNLYRYHKIVLHAKFLPLNELSFFFWIIGCYIFDLFNTLEIRSSSQKGGLAVPDANVVPVHSTSDVIELMNLGSRNRAVSFTAMNDRSSRSHRW